LQERSLTVLFIDDHALMRTAISQALTVQPGIGRILMAQNYTEAEKQVVQLVPDIIWLDLHVGSSDGIAEIGRLKKLATSRIMALTDQEDEGQAFAAIMAGAQGYRSKQDIDAGEIIATIQLLCRDEYALRPELLTRLLQRLRTAAVPLWGSENELGNHSFMRSAEFDQLTQLTSREHEIIQLISRGFRDRDIAKSLLISEKTVRKHVQSILSKLRVQNRTEAAYLVHHRASLPDT
jgi:two-component system, NarL family, response regulator LiaR